MRWVACGRRHCCVRGGGGCWHAGALRQQALSRAVRLGRHTGVAPGPAGVSSGFVSTHRIPCPRPYRRLQQLTSTVVYLDQLAFPRAGAGAAATCADAWAAVLLAAKQRGKEREQQRRAQQQQQQLQAGGGGPAQSFAGGEGGGAGFEGAGADDYGSGGNGAGYDDFGEEGLARGCDAIAAAVAPTSNAWTCMPLHLSVIVIMPCPFCYALPGCVPDRPRRGQRRWLRR